LGLALVENQANVEKKPVGSIWMYLRVLLHELSDRLRSRKDRIGHCFAQYGPRQVNGVEQVREQGKMLTLCERYQRACIGDDVPTAHRKVANSDSSSSGG
jgi:hypothetical protein